MKPKPGSEKVRKRTARRGRVAKAVRNTERPRLTVFRSARHIYAQIVDAQTGQTLVGASSRSKQIMGDATATGNVAEAQRVGKVLAGLAREKQIPKVVFNRNGFLYHGRIRALAEAARENGLRF